MIKRLRNWALKIAYSFSNLSLQTKLIVSYICIILVPIILFSIYMFNDFYHNTIRDIVKKNEYILEVEKNNINNNIEIMERTAQLSISSKDIMEYLQSRSELDTKALIDFNNNANFNLLRLQFSNPNIEHIRLYSKNPLAKEIWPVFLNESRIINNSWYKEVLDLKGTELWALDRFDKDVMQRYTTDANENQGKVSLLHEINYPNDTHIGILQIDMLQKNFFPKTYSQIQDGQSQMIILDKANQIFTNVNNTFLKNLDISDVVLQFQARQDSKITSFEFSQSGIPYLCQFVHLDRLDVNMLNVISLESAFKETRTTRNHFILIIIGLITLLSIITYILQSFILKKLHILRESMTKVRQGNFNIDIKLRGSDEVGELAHHFRMMLRKINSLIVEAVNKQAATKEAELRSLKNQIDSHFLYNTLENLKMMAEIEAQYTISDALTSLGGMMRYNLKWTSDYVRLKDEIIHCKNYISIMNIRYNGCLVLDLDIPQEHLEQELLKMSLQPIVENAVKHGMRANATELSPMTIMIRTYFHNNMAIIEVTDNGRGISEHDTEELNRKINMGDMEFIQLYNNASPREGEGSGIGLRNVNQRILLNYGKEYGVRIESKEEYYTKVTINLPFFILSGGLLSDAKAIDR